jgi:hypothetical protein
MNNLSHAPNEYFVACSLLFVKTPTDSSPFKIRFSLVVVVVAGSGEGQSEVIGSPAAVKHWFSPVSVASECRVAEHVERPEDDVEKPDLV